MRRHAHAQHEREHIARTSAESVGEARAEAMVLRHTPRTAFCGCRRSLRHARAASEKRAQIQTLVVDARANMGSRSHCSRTC